MTSALFRDAVIELAGVVGEHVEISTADPVNFHQAIEGGSPLQTIDGKLFIPKGSSSLPAVIVVPGSLGVAPSHLAHAEALVAAGAAALVIDPFGARNVTSTVANQAQYSFAASAFDVSSAAQFLAGLPSIDPRRIGAQGHSRGGSAVLMAASRRFADKVLPGGPTLRGVYAAYPWCGQQFRDPSVGDTVVRCIVGSRDEWCSPAQVQAYVHAVRLSQGDASFRLVLDAHHSFDRLTPIERVADASVSPNAPTIYVDDDGSMIHPVSGEASSSFTDRDLMRFAVQAGYGVRGASIGSDGDLPALFREDMMTFWRSTLGL